MEAPGIGLGCGVTPGCSMDEMLTIVRDFWDDGYADGSAEGLNGHEPAGPWRVRIDPYPFAERPATFRLVRRLLPKRGKRDGNSFRAEFAAVPLDTLDVQVRNWIRAEKTKS
mgnify:CR=1 FL=1